ncbi:uncharacterized protein L969DRAFT_94699 [Mixia osmundae IAM 14324]|uniref:Trm112p-domain-containing protein n=1 Tax=Mixia osmundae (strain CBS 9802 / IAM 14324 / JCM 22182 / KY 12970) TaxID=764103 RepID=G7DVQ8_MIXOS|nr:uncharacterized protein L969DRAFT_94699 [Mixia osmundae IAM 14324]KEI39650.1 hypothetical protein L969DRAFT_94699 [Mixia osmundae IAM 14324]GAA94668.1 hypothetical protein E5Q_01321 [Mixia osmundae IAM 14324]
MRLITHNLLSCHAKLCSAPTNFPLDLQNCTTVEDRPVDFNPDFLRGFLPKLEWPALLRASRQLGDASLPEQPPASFTLSHTTASTEDAMQTEKATSSEDEEEVLKKLHHVLLELHVIDGEMTCPSCHRVFPIKSGIPNMLLAEHELRK